MKSETQKSVPFFDYKWLYREHGTNLSKIINGVMEKGAFILQGELKEFEEKLANYLNVKHAIGVGNCTDGLLLSLKSLNLQKGDEVLFPAHTFVATAAAIFHAGATPVPCEIGSDHLMDPKHLEDKITKKTKAIVPVQLNGRTANMQAIMEIAEKHDLIVVEDAAQALGSTYKGRMAGSFGVAAAFSFYPAKTLGCLGDGGAVVTNNDEIAEKVFLFRDHGRDKNGVINFWGMNSRLDNMQAAVLSYFLDHYNDTVKRRRELAAIYNKNLKGIESLVLPPYDSNEDHFDIFQNYEIEAKNRDNLKEFLGENGVGTLVQWGGKAVHQNEHLGLMSHHLPATERMVASSLLLPLNLSLADEDVTYVCDKIKEYYDAAAS